MILSFKQPIDILPPLFWKRVLRKLKIFGQLLELCNLLITMNYCTNNKKLHQNNGHYDSQGFIIIHSHKCYTIGHKKTRYRKISGHVK